MITLEEMEERHKEEYEKWEKEKEELQKKEEKKERRIKKFIKFYYTIKSIIMSILETIFALLIPGSIAFFFQEVSLARFGIMIVVIWISYAVISGLEAGEEFDRTNNFLEDD